MATLYEMSEMAITLYEMLQAEVIDEQVVKDTIEGMGADEKVENYCKIIRQFEADAEAYKLEKTRFADKQSQAEKNIKRLKDNLLMFLTATQQEKIKSGVFTVAKSKSKAVNIIDETLIPIAFLKPQPPKVDKTAIKKAISDGIEVSGAEIITNESVRIK